jgi:hypothetical protein
MTELELSRAIEDLLVRRNLRGMARVQEHLTPGYYLRAAESLRKLRGTVLIGTGFPVLDTFETDGPVGAIALYQSLEELGMAPVIVCGKPLSTALAADYRVREISVGDPASRQRETREALAELRPQAIISIERPGLSAGGRYFNMRGEDISPRCACFDYFLDFADCPTIAMGDGGNEIGMGNVSGALEELDIIPAVTRCDELLIADVSNWAALGLIAIIGYWQGTDLLGKLAPREILAYLSQRGSVDGVTRENTLTEDGLAVEEGEQLLEELRSLTGFGDSA